jgi:hypothetical protein
MGWACGIYGERSSVCRFLEGKHDERDHLENPGVDGRRILRRIFRKWDVCMDWNKLVRDRDSWRAVVNAVMNLRVP